MKQTFRNIRLGKANKIKLGLVNSIIQEYADDGYTMTLRQLYYQLVSRDVIPNRNNEYAKLSKLLKEGRMGGIVDWNAIEDRLRVPFIPSAWDTPKDVVRSAMYQYRKDRQKGQETYIEVWVEKDALSGVLKRVTKEYHVRLLVNRGYGSVTAIHDAYNRFKDQYLLGKKNCKILYLGDHDPSGMDMIRDITDRISEMLEVDEYLEDGRMNFNVEPIALTMEQINEFNPPENPAKLTDPRSKWYVKKYGYNSWEVDALDPKTLNKLVSDNIENNIDMELFNEVKVLEELDKTKLKKLLNDI